MSQWIVFVILVTSPRYSDSVCNITNCVECNGQTQCDVCTDGYYLQSGSCVHCPDRCLHCTNDTECTKCKNIFWGVDSLCKNKCSTVCVDEYCDDITGFCNQCLSGKYGTYCGQSCTLCKDGQCDLRKCTYGCKDGYYQDSTTLRSTYCLECGNKNCLTCSNRTYCTQCEQGYYRNYYHASDTRDGYADCKLCTEICEIENTETTKSTPDTSTEHSTSTKPLSSLTDPRSTTKAKTYSPETQTNQMEPNESTIIKSTTIKSTKQHNTMAPTTIISTKQPDIPQTDASVHKSDDNLSTIIGAAAGGGTVVVLAIVVILVVCFIKRRLKENNENQIENQITEPEDVKLDIPVYSKCKTHRKPNNQPTEDKLYSLPNKPRPRKIKHTRKEESHIMIDLEVKQVTTVDSNVDDVQLEIVDGDGVTTDIDMGESIPASDTYYNMDGLIKSQVKVTQLFDYVKQKNDYDKEFTKLLKGLQRSCNEALKPHNRQKNRYNGIYAYDATRVVLQSGTYINANYIDGHNKTRAYIASLGPTASAMNDYETFWEMIWQHKVESIVMLTKLEEGVKMKCEQYWPNQGDVMTCGQYIMEGVSMETFADFVVRRTAFRHVNTSDKRYVIQYQYTAWPDRSVPDSVVSLVAFRDKVQQQDRKTTSPIVVHCSAGIGRTGTYIALDYLLHQARDDAYVDIFGCAIGLRGQRVNLIQTEQQYEYLHHCVLYGITCLSDPIKEVKLKTGVNNEQISTQYDALKSIESIKRGWSLTLGNRNKKQKGSGHLDDGYHVHLESSRCCGVNGVYINSYLRMNHFIISQTPQSTNVQHFISMVYQENCPIIVCLDDDSTQDKNTGRYVPSDNTIMKIGQYQVTCKASNVREEYTVRDLTITNLKSAVRLNIQHYQIHGWTSQNIIPSDSKSFMKLVREVNANNTKLQECPIMVHCHTGADRSGLFCGISTMLEILTIDKQLSIINVIYHIRERCHTAFSNLQTFKFCYDRIKDLLNRDGENDYVNIPKR